MQPYEFSPVRGRIGGPYDSRSFRGGGPSNAGAVTGCPELAIAGAALAQRMGEDYLAIAGHLDAGAEALTGSFFGDLGSALSSVVRPIEQTVSHAVHPLANVIRPGIASATHAAAALIHGVRQYNPVAMAQVAAIKARALAGSMKDSVAFHLLRAVTEKQLAPALALIHRVSPVLHYAQAVVSLIPGIGSGVGAALGAAQALADGQPISDMAIGAVRGAIPGGPFAQMAFDATWGLVRGRPVNTALLSALRAQAPGELAKRAVDTALALAAARTAQDRRRVLQGAAMREIASRVPRLPQGMPAGLLPRFV